MDDIATLEGAPRELDDIMVEEGNCVSDIAMLDDASVDEEIKLDSASIDDGEGVDVADSNEDEIELDCRAELIPIPNPITDDCGNVVERI